MISRKIETDIPVANPSRAEIQARLALQAPVPDPDMGIYTMTTRGSPAFVLSRLPGDDLQAITNSATIDAATCLRYGWILLVLAVPTWLAGLVYLFLLHAPIAATATLSAGSLGTLVGVLKLSRANHDRFLVHELHRLFRPMQHTECAGAENHGTA